MSARREGFSGLALGVVVVGVVAGLLADRPAWRLAAAAGALAALGVALVQVRRQARRIAERSDELEHLSAELLRANRAKSEFLASVSHELRTPLAAIVGFVDLLRDGAYGELAPRMIQPVERIEASAAHLQRLVDQILDLAKMAAGRLDVQPDRIPLRAFVIDVASEVESLVQEKGLALSLAVPATLPKVVADPMRLRQIVVNLLGNAIKFTPQGTVTVRAVLVADAGAARRRPLLEPGGPWVVLQVADTGIGIPEKDLDRIFEEFVQVNPGPRADSARRGTGLGLSISRKLARLMGGDITVESELGAGATFALWLPIEGAGPELPPMR